MSDESEGEEHYYSGSEEDDESHGSESGGDNNHGLLDLEASEASSEPDYDAQGLSDAGSHDGSYAEYNFPKFMQLPPEIREMVWGAFCPDLGPDPRVFELHLYTHVSPPGAVHLPTVVRAIVPGPQLESQTEPMRTVLAVHQESRALGLKSAPHELSLSNQVMVRYHEERDVLFVAWDEEILLRGIALRFQELGIEAQNIAFPSIVCHYNRDELVDVMYLLPQAKRLFILDEEDDMRDPDGVSPMQPRDYAWTVADKVNRYRLDTEEEGEYGLSNAVSRIFCWPDLDKFPEFAEENVTKPEDDWWWTSRIMEFRTRLWAPLEDSRELNEDDIPQEEKAEAIERLQNIQVWPMVRFNFGEGLDLFYYMETHGLDKDCLPPDYFSDSEGFDEEIEDRYESSGIDDDPIDDSTSDEDEDEDELLGQHLGQDTSHLHGSSSQLFDDRSDMGGLPPANFSSGEEDIREQDHITLTSDSDDDSGSQSRTFRRKRQVVDSDSDESATETEQTPPSRRRSRIAHPLDIEDLDVDNDDDSSDAEPVREFNRRARAMPIDSEDEDEGGNKDDDEDDMPQPSRSGRRGGRALPADSEDDDDEVVVQQPSGSRGNRRGRVVQEDSDEDDEEGQSDSQGGGAKTKVADSSDEEESSSSDGDDDDPPPPKRVSLAKRLSMESRQARSRQGRHDDDYEADEMTGDGYGYSDDQEDEVDGTDMGMAEEYDGEDGESEEEY